MDRRLLTYDPQMELLAPSSTPGGASSTPAIEHHVSGELEEVELASRFLELPDRSGLERFLRQLDATLRKEGRPVDARVAERLIRHLVDVARSLPLDTASGAGHRRSTAVSPAKVHAASESVFGSEFEGLSPEDRDFHVARSFIRLAADSLLQLGKQEPASHPAAAAQLALLKAARRHAPGLRSLR
ncbi:hypothetical protein [Caballeronia sp. LZ035]|uniref:hypothetical protein n=1 Tax=Caballeronia sp. LZ035 TaxID=3038568 RepID=UPI0028641279|nr:hypothetical protein [Caballeronia sp. LZ035]MDR5757127.1 hypothetical protein [Caballeronia sp. LZ035]